MSLASKFFQSASSGGTGTAVETWAMAIGDEETPIVAGLNVMTFPIPFNCVIQDVFLSFGIAPTGSLVQLDVNYVEDKNGSVVGAGSIFTTPVTVDISEKTSLTAATPPVLNGSLTTRLEGDIMNVDFDQVGSTIPGTAPKLVFELLRS